MARKVYQFVDRLWIPLLGKYFCDFHNFRGQPFNSTNFSNTLLWFPQTSWTTFEFHLTRRCANYLGANNVVHVHFWTRASIAEAFLKMTLLLLFLLLLTNFYNFFKKLIISKILLKLVQNGNLLRALIKNKLQTNQFISKQFRKIYYNYTNLFLNDKSSSATTRTTTTKSFLRPLPPCLLAVKNH